MKLLFSLVFILICIPSYATNEAYQQQTADLMAILKNIEAQNTQLQTEVNAYAKENPKKSSKIEIKPTTKPKIVQKPPTMLTPMDREAMSSAIFFAGGAPRPIPQKRQNNFRPPTKSDTSSNSDVNKDDLSTDDKNDSDSSDSSTSSDSSSYSSGGGGYYPPYDNQMIMTFIASNTSDPTYTYTTTTSPTTVTFDFPTGNLSLGQKTFQESNGLTTSLTKVSICGASYDISTCILVSDNISNATVTISNTLLQDAASPAKRFIGYTKSTIENTPYVPIFYFLGVDSNNTNYQYAINYPGSSGNITCSESSGTTSCKQSSGNLSQAFTVSSQ